MDHAILRRESFNSDTVWKMAERQISLEDKMGVYLAKRCTYVNIIKIVNMIVNMVVSMVNLLFMTNLPSIIISKKDSFLFENL